MKYTDGLSTAVLNFEEKTIVYDRKMKNKKIYYEQNEKVNGQWDRKNLQKNVSFFHFIAECTSIFINQVCL